MIWWGLCVSAVGRSGQIILHSYFIQHSLGLVPWRPQEEKQLGLSSRRRPWRWGWLKEAQEFKMAPDEKLLLVFDSFTLLRVMSLRRFLELRSYKNSDPILSRSNTSTSLAQLQNEQDTEEFSWWRGELYSRLCVMGILILFQKFNVSQS